MATKISQDEIAVELEVCKQALNDYGVSNIKLNTLSGTGYPDRMFFIPGGKPLIIEFKAPGEGPRPKQDFIINQLLKIGYNVQVHDNVEEAVHAIVIALRGALNGK